MDTIIAQFATLINMLRSNGFDVLARRVDRAFSLARGRVSDASVCSDDIESRGVAMLRGAGRAIEAAIGHDWTGAPVVDSGAETGVRALVAIARMPKDIIGAEPIVGRGKGARFGRDPIAQRLGRAPVISAETTKVETVADKPIVINGWRLDFNGSEWRVWCTRWRDGKLATFDLATVNMLIEAETIARSVDAPEKGRAPDSIRKLQESGA